MKEFGKQEKIISQKNLKQKNKMKNPFKIERDHRKNLVYYFQNLFITIGKFVEKGKYVIQLRTAFGTRVITIYRSTKKPKIKHLGLLSIIGIPVYLLSVVLFPIMFILMLLYYVFLSFVVEKIVKEFKYLDDIDKISSVLLLIFALIGLLSTIRFFYLYV